VKSLIVLCSGFFVASLFNVGLAVSQTTRPSQTARPSQAVSAAHQQAMEECKARYGGVQRSWLWQRRYMSIEACFKEKTGMYPFQAHVNCSYRFPRNGRAYFC
jgi:acyl-homoserine lactone acylase PvdQ